jgi:hypothetical protein
VPTEADIAPAAGGRLADFGEFLKDTEQPCFLPAEERQVWAPNARGELTRLPMTCLEPVDAAVTRKVLQTPRVWIISYLLEGTEECPANCLLYVCRDADYHWDSLSKNGRKAIRRGLRSSTVRLCTWDELAAKGYPALAETDERHGYGRPDVEALQRFVSLRRDRPFYEVWGAWKEDDLVSWLVAMKIDEWVIFEASPSRHAALRIFSSNAVRYQAMRALLCEQRYKQVLTGLSSINPNTDPTLLWKFNTRMGFEGVPVRRVFVPHAMLRPMLNWRGAAWTWEKLSRGLPQFSILHKVAGLSGLLSGRNREPLAWAEAVHET